MESEVAVGRCRGQELEEGRKRKRAREMAHLATVELGRSIRTEEEADANQAASGLVNCMLEVSAV